MARAGSGWVRRLPSGLWAATVHSPAGRITESFDRQTDAQSWANEQYSQMRRGEWIDPRLAKTTIGEMWDRYAAGRRLEKASRARDESHWRCHVEPTWRRVPVGAVLKPDITGWITAMERRRIGAPTIEGSLGVLRAMLSIAVDAGIIRANPAQDVSAPRRDAHLDRVLAPHEDEQLLASLDQQFPDRPDARLLVELMLYCGLRWEEAAAIDREHVDMRQRLINVGPVVERDGTIRPYPKSAAGARPVPVDEDVWPRLRTRCMAAPPRGLVITSVRGKVLRYSSWHDRVWQRALVGVQPADWSGFGAWLDAGMARRGLAQDRDLAAAAGINASLVSSWRAGRFHPRPVNLDRLAAVIGEPPPALRARGEPLLAAPQPTPHDLRHTYGTRLGDAGVPVRQIMALMGHENLESVQRYLHASESRFDRARAAMREGRRVAGESR
jgi:integrase